MKIKTSYTCTVISAVVVCLFSMGSLVQGFFGNNFLGIGLPCAVGCGNGPLGTNPRLFLNPFGEMAGYAGGPLADKFEQAGNRVVDRAEGKLEEKLKKLDALSEEKLKKLDTILGDRQKALEEFANVKMNELHFIAQESLQDLHELLDDNIKNLSAELRKRFGDLEGTGVKFASLLEQVGRALLCIAIFIAWALFSIYKYYAEVLQKRKNYSIIIPAIKFTGIASAVLIAMIILLPLVASIDDVKSRHEDAFHKAMDSLDVGTALFHSEQLAEIDHADPVYFAYKMKTALIEDTLVKQLVYAKDDGIDLLQRRIEQLHASNRENGISRDRDLDVLAAIVLWQARSDRYSQYVGANLCASALSGKGYDKKDTFYLKPLALHYLNTYLAYPVAKQDLAAIGIDIDALNKGVEKDGIELRSNEELEAMFADSTKDLGQEILIASKAHPLYFQISYGLMIRALYRKVIPAYADLVVTNARISSAINDQEKSTLFKRRHNLAQIILDSWDRLASDMEAQFISATSYRIQSLRGLHAMYSRASQYAGSDAIGVPPPGDIAKAFHAKWVRNLEGSVKNRRHEVLKFLANKEFVEQEANMIRFEQSFLDLYRLRSQWSPQASPEQTAKLIAEAENSAALSTHLGIFICGTSKDVQSCDGRAMIPKPFLHLLSSYLPKQIEPGLSQWSRYIKSDMERSLPVI